MTTSTQNQYVHPTQKESAEEYNTSALERLWTGVMTQNNDQI